MPDRYWEDVGKKLNDEKAKAAASGSYVVPCVGCGGMFFPDSLESKYCGQCFGRPTYWRGKGSLGSKPVIQPRSEDETNAKD